MTERVLRRLTRKCAEVEEAGKMMKILMKKGVGFASIEQFSISHAGKRHAKVPGEKGRKQVVMVEMERVFLSHRDKLRGLKFKKKTVLK